MTILVFAEHDNETLSDQTAKAVDAAAKIGGDIHVLVAGKGAGAVAEAAGKLDGVTKVLHADGDDYGDASDTTTACLRVPNECHIFNRKLKVLFGKANHLFIHRL